MRTIGPITGHTGHGGQCRVGNDVPCGLKRTFVVYRPCGIEGSCNEFDVKLR
jgi:hypothetical protein